MSALARTVIATAWLASAAACDNAAQQPVEPTPDPRSAAPSASAAQATSSPTSSATLPARAAASPTDEPSETATAPDGPPPGMGTRPALFADDGTLLPQTKDKPSLESPFFKEQIQELFAAIKTNDPERARPFFFPVQAYEKVKGIKNPAADWRWRLWKAFRRNVKEYHKRLGKEPEKAEFVRLELRNPVKWMKPGSEGNLLGYYRVTRSWLHYKNAEGKARKFDLTAMISWRGEWYVVHLHGFK